MALVGGKTEHEVLLFSNSSMDLFPTNKPQSFTCKLAIPLELSGLWYVGVKMIQFPCTWLDIQNEFTVMIRGMPKDAGYQFRIQGNISKGDYPTVKSLIDVINIKMAEEFIKSKSRENFPTSINSLLSLGALTLTQDGHVRYSATNSTLFKESSIWVFDANGGIDEAGPKLGCYLGANIGSGIQDGKAGAHMASLTIHDAAISLMCPIAEPVLQGDEYVQSLLTIPAIGEKGKYIAYHFDIPTFHRVIADYLSTITINLHFDSGSLVQFQAGKTVVSLIFTKDPQHY